MIYVSYSQDRADDVGKAVRNNMMTPFYKETFEDAVLRSDAKATRKFNTVSNGKFYAVGSGGALTGRGSSCCAGETLIKTEHGDVPIQTIHHMEKKPKVLSFDINNKALCYKTIKATVELKNKKLYIANTNHGRSLKFTNDHKFYISNLEQFVPFDKLTTQINLLDYNLNNDKIIKSPSVFMQTATVYDLQIEDTACYFANEILVHNCMILDDLIKDRADASSDSARRKREEWFTSTAYTRLMSDDKVQNGRILLIMTRWAYNDIGSFLLNSLAHENWHILKCPAIAEDNNDLFGRKPGEALWPDKKPVEVLKDTKEAVGSDDWNALYQQRPLPKEGGLIKMHWFQRYDPHKLWFMERCCRKNKNLPEEMNWFYKIVISLDTAYKPEQMNDPSAITVWGYAKNRQYLLETLAERLEFPQLIKWVMKIHQKYQSWNLGPVPILIEDKASGQSLIQVLRQRTNIPVIPMLPEKSKIIRMSQVSDYIEAGRVIFPERAVWLTDMETELAQFPYGVHDDRADSMSQYLKWIYKPRRVKSKQKMRMK